jgi:hypothetical protein
MLPQEFGRKCALRSANPTSRTLPLLNHQACIGLKRHFLLEQLLQRTAYNRIGIRLDG